jgi:predicted dehydrogenase
MIAEVHARAVRSAGGTVAALVGSTAESARRSAGRLGAERAVSCLEELLSAEDIDVVHICTPTHVHAEQAAAVLASGKAVICEKPLAGDRRAAQQLAQTAEASGLVNAVPFVYRFYPTVRDARARIRHGAAGRVHLIHGSYLQDWLALPTDNNWRVDPKLGGASRAFGDIGVHWCDLVEFTTGHRISRLVARTLTAYPRRESSQGPVTVKTEDAVALIFETDRGALGSLMVSQVSHGRKNRLWFSVDAAAEALAFDQELPDSLWRGGREWNQTIMRGSPGSDPWAARYNSLPAGHPQGYQDSFSAFVADVYAAVRGERVDGLPSFADGLRAAEITSAVMLSAAREDWVEVRESQDRPAPVGDHYRQPSSA